MSGPNMEYTMVENTRAAMVQVNESLDTDGLSEHEVKAALLLLKECSEFIGRHGGVILEIAREEEGFNLGGIAKSVQESVRSLLGDDAIEEVL